MMEPMQPMHYPPGLGYGVPSQGVRGSYDEEEEEDDVEESVEESSSSEICG